MGVHSLPGREIWVTTALQEEKYGCPKVFTPLCKIQGNLLFFTLFTSTFKYATFFFFQKENSCEKERHTHSCAITPNWCHNVRYSGKKKHDNRKLILFPVLQLWPLSKLFWPIFNHFFMQMMLANWGQASNIGESRQWPTKKTDPTYTQAPTETQRRVGYHTLPAAPGRQSKTIHYRWFPWKKPNHQRASTTFQSHNSKSQECP